MRIVFYTTLGCHLCEHVPPMLQLMAHQITLTIDVIDIASDDSLVERYGQEIPVLYRPDIDMDIAWPFSIDDLHAFLLYND